MVLTITIPEISNTKTKKQRTLRESTPSPKGRERVFLKSVPLADNITKYPQNIKAAIKIFIMGAAWDAVSSKNSSKVETPAFLARVIIIYASSEKHSVARIIPKELERDGMLKYSKISRPEAKPAPMTSPIYTKAMPSACFI